MDIRKMDPSDAGQVSRLLVECYRWLGQREGLSPSQTRFLESARGGEETVRRESEGETYLVGQEAGGIVGMVAVSRDTITKLYVHPSRHRAGLGRALCEAAESVITLAGYTKASLGAFPSAVPFYEAMGFRAIGTRLPAGVLEGVTITVMEKGLGGDPATGGGGR